LIKFRTFFSTGYFRFRTRLVLRVKFVPEPLSDLFPCKVIPSFVPLSIPIIVSLVLVLVLVLSDEFSWWRRRPDTINDRRNDCRLFFLGRCCTVRFKISFDQMPESLVSCPILRFMTTLTYHIIRSRFVVLPQRCFRYLEGCLPFLPSFSGRNLFIRLVTKR